MFAYLQERNVVGRRGVNLAVTDIVLSRLSGAIAEMSKEKARRRTQKGTFSLPQESLAAPLPNTDIGRQ